MWKINCISDTHNNHKILSDFNLINNGVDTDCDLLIHAGDISGRGNPISIDKFAHWYNSLDNYNHKVFIAGNHDISFEKDPSTKKEFMDNIKLQQEFAC